MENQCRLKVDQQASKEIVEGEGEGANDEGEGEEKNMEEMSYLLKEEIIVYSENKRILW